MRKIIPLVLMALPFVITSCDKDEEKVDNSIQLAKTAYTLHYEDKVQIEAISVSDISYASESDYVATVSNSGLITAGRVGETTLSLDNGEDQKNISVVVEPEFDVYPEPHQKVEFGASMQAVKAAFGSDYIEIEDALGYMSYHKDYDYMFMFENDKLVSYALFIPTLSIPDELIDFLAERYRIVAVEGYRAAFMNEKQDMMVGVTATDDLLNMMIIYYPNLTRSGDQAVWKEKMAEIYAGLSKKLF